MSYFSEFPTRNNYPVSLQNSDKTEEIQFDVSFPDFFRCAALAYPKVNDGSFFYERVQVLDGERPEQLSYRLYGSTMYYWTFFIINDDLRLGESLQWTLSDREIVKKMETEYNGLTILVDCIRDESTGTMIKNTFEQFQTFIIGETIEGQQSGIRATIKDLRPKYGQIITINDKEKSTIGSFLTISKYISLYIRSYCLRSFPT